MIPRTQTSLLPGLALCLAVTAAAFGLNRLQQQWLGHVWLEPLVLAILLGVCVRSAWPLGQTWQGGIAFSARTLLEVAVILLGFSLSARTIVAAGPALPAGIAAIVGIAVLSGYGIGRALGLKHRMALLVACGNAICGNSAIAAVAPVIGADGDDVVSSIAFTAVLGVLVVLGLPLLCMAIGLSSAQSGIFAGLTVYAVPQVIAAASPMGAAAVQIGTLVKLIRVLMLGPVILVLSLLARRQQRGPGAPAATTGAVPLHKLLPWFIVGFAAAIALRSAGAVPRAALPPIADAAGILTIVSMAALGLGVDVRVVARAGLRVTAAVTSSLLLLGGLSLTAILLLFSPFH